MRTDDKTTHRKFIQRNYAVILFYLALAFFIFYPVLAGRLISPGDARSYYYPFKVYYSSLPGRGLPIWMPYQFAGISYLGSSESGVLYPPNFFFFASGSAYLYNLLLILHYVAAATFTYLYLKLICGRKLPAVCGGMVFGLAGFLMAHKGHLNIVNAAAWLPLMLYLYERIRREMRVSLSLCAALAAAVQVFAGHYQISLYTYIVLGLFVLYFGVKAEKGTRKRFLLLAALPLALGVILALPQLLATWGVSRVATGTGNGYAFFTGYSFSPWLFLQFIFPFFYSNYGTGFFAPGNLSETSGFLGLAVLVFAAVALLRYRKRDPQVRFWLWVGLLALFLMLGSYNPLYRLTWYVPVYNLFRIPSRHLLEFDFALTVLGALGLSYVLKEKEENRRWLLAGLLALISLGVFMALLAGPIYRALVSDRGTAFRQGLEHALRWNNPAILVPLACVFGYLLAWLVWYYGRRFSRWGVAVLLLVMALELFSFGAFIDNKTYAISEVKAEAASSWRGYLAGSGAEARVLYTGSYPYNMDAVNQDIALLNGYESLIVDDFAYLTDLGLAQDEVSWRNLTTDNVTLSAANCGYVVVEKGSAPLGLESVYATADYAPGPAGAEVVLGPDWQGTGFTMQDGEARLSAPAGSNAGIGQEFPLYQGRRYLVTFEARANEDFTDGLRIGVEYQTKSGQESSRIDLKVEDFAPELQVHTEVIDVPVQSTEGRLLPINGSLFFSTSSAAPIFIQNVNITYLDEIPLLLFRQRLYDDEAVVEPGSQAPVYQPVYEDDEAIVYRNLNCLPRAFVVRDLSGFEDLAELKERSFKREYDPSLTGQVPAADLDKIGASSFAPGKVDPVEISEDHLAFDVEMEGDGFVVDADQYFAGWTAAVDGVETPIYQVDGFMRGVKVPAGSHRLEFRYAAPGLRTSLWLCLAFFLLTLAWLVWLIFSARGRRFDTRFSPPVGEGLEKAGEGTMTLPVEEFFVGEEKEDKRKAKARAKRRRRDV